MIGFTCFSLFFLVTNGNLYGQACDCTEYIYLNEPALGAVLKFEVGPGIALTEVVGANGGAPPAQHWYPGTGTSELPNPHGLTNDLNGNYYIADTGLDSGLRKFDCDGNIFPVDTNSIHIDDHAQNLFSIGNILYSNQSSGPAAYDLCTGDFLGAACFNDTNGNQIPVPAVPSEIENYWGLSYNATTEMVYATKRYSTATMPAGVWTFTKAQLDASIDGGDCIDPLIIKEGAPTVSIGDRRLPDAFGEQVFGIVSDHDGNFFVVMSQFGVSSHLLKYDSTGALLAVVQNQINFGIGIVWSEETNRLYISNLTDDPAYDCISVYDGNDLSYLGTGAPNPNLPDNNFAKAIAIVKECCPVGVPSEFTIDVCGGIGDKFYLNEEAFGGCDGVVCGSSWVPQTLSGMTFDPCDNSVTITGEDCSTFTLDLTATTTGCPAQSTTFTICNNPIPTAEAGTGISLCSTGIVTLSNLGASITPDTLGGTWSTSGTGVFDDTNAATGIFGTATTYTPSANDVEAGIVMLTLTTDDPGLTGCTVAVDEVTVIINKVDCGIFPWDGQ